MAKKRRTRPASPGRSTTSPSGITTTARAAAGGRPPAPAPSVAKAAPASPGGPNRQARKEEARRERERLQRRMARGRALRRVAIVLAVVLVGVAVGVYFLFIRQSAAEAAGCSPVTTIAPYNPATEDRTHIGAPGSPVTTPPALSTYRTGPPTSGPHDPSPLPAGVYDAPPDVYRTIHSLEHAAVVVWYRPSATGSALTELKSFFQENPQDIEKVIVAPYDYPSQGARGQLPAGKNMVLVAWHHMQSCDQVSLGAARAFIGSYRINPSRPADYKGDAPEPQATI